MAKPNPLRGTVICLKPGRCLHKGGWNKCGWSQYDGVVGMQQGSRPQCPPKLPASSTRADLKRGWAKGAVKTPNLATPGSRLALSFLSSLQGLFFSCVRFY